MTAITFEKSMVSRMLEEALEFCAEKSGFNGKDKALKALGGGDCCVCEYLRYSLSKSVAEYLGSMDDGITAVYTHEPEYASGADTLGAGQSRAHPGLNLIVRVNRKSAALSSVVASLGAVLAEELKQLGCPNATVLCRELDVKLADEQDVQKRIGYGALIDSLYVRPIEIWHR